MNDIEIVLALLLAVVLLAMLARRLRIPYPILLVLGGLALALIPGVPNVELRPDLVFLLFLPPLLYSSAWTTSWRDFHFNLRPIGLLAIGLVLVTTTLVALAARAAIPGLPWAAAFTLGAIVSPTDAVAATAIAQRLGVPRRLVTVVEGESLVNDATGLVAYRFAVAAVVTGAFSLPAALVQFVLVSAGGVLIGLATGWLATWLNRRIEDTSVAIALSFLMPFAAYLPAEALGASGVLAAVTAGLYAGRRSVASLSPSTRIQAFAVWEMLVFLLNGLIFILIGLQLRAVVGLLTGFSAVALLWYGALVSAVVIAARIIWTFAAIYLPRLASASLRARDPSPPWHAVAVLSWMGMRGVVSLAAGLSLPLTVASGRPFPGRDLIVFLTFAVLLATLVAQGLSLPALIRVLGVGEDDSSAREEQVARLAAARAGLGRLDEIAAEGWAPRVAVKRLRDRYEHMTHRFDGDGNIEEAERDTRAAGVSRRLRREVIGAERAAVIRLRDEGTINDEVLRRIERELDLQDVWLEA
ncbi:MAG TPA: Na+/H+ antiporter [Ktedonobacterales bacterium]|nr:Na+/H+ antiporter [Ktedonobacterales bacterium]